MNVEIKNAGINVTKSGILINKGRIKMIKNIVTDESKLQNVSHNSSNQSYTSQVVKDLIDTAHAHKKDCIGLAANQIGHNVRIFVLRGKDGIMAVINPEVVCMTGGRKQSSEGCMSRPGKKAVRVKRFKKVKLRFATTEGQDFILCYLCHL